MTTVIAMALAGGAAGLLLAELLHSAIAAAASARRLRGERSSDRARRWIGPVAALGARIGAPQAPDRLVARLAAAGLDRQVGLPELMAVKSGLAALASLVGAAMMLGTSIRSLALVSVICAAAGFLAPDLWLTRLARQRMLRAALELPALLDLLRVTVEAGLPISRALAEVGARSGGVIAAELRAGERRVAFGERWAVVVAELDQRLPLPEIAVTVAALRRSLWHGTPLAPALVALATEARSARVRKLHEHASRAVPQMQLAIALLLVPAVLLVIGAITVAAVR